MSPRKKPRDRSRKSEEDMNTPIAAGRTRNRAAAFGESDQPVESPVRKKQIVAASVSVNTKSKTLAKGSMNAGVGISVDHPNNVGVGLINGAASDGNSSQEGEEHLDIAPPIQPVPKKQTIIKKTTDKVNGESRPEVVKPGADIERVNGTRNNQRPVEIHNKENDRRRNWFVGLGWVGDSIFLCIFVFSVMIWSGLLLNERAIYQLESLECREQLQQAHQAMGLSEQIDFTNGNENAENDISDRLEAQQFYMQELETQVQYWKKEAKKHQRYGDGFKTQCQEDLRHLLSQIKLQNEDN